MAKRHQDNTPILTAKCYIGVCVHGAIAGMPQFLLADLNFSVNDILQFNISATSLHSSSVSGRQLSMILFSMSVLQM